MLWHLDRQSPAPLHEQLAGCVRRALGSGELAPGERLPPARELAAVVDVHANTVLQAYRTLRTEGVVEFRRGRGVQVSSAATQHAPVHDAARALVRLARRHGYSGRELVELVTALSSSGGSA